MAFGEWVAVGAAGIFLHSQAKKNREEREQDECEHEEYLHDLRQREAEWDRKRKVNSARRNMPCFFADGMTQQDFEMLAYSAAKKIKRIKTVIVRGATVFASVESQTRGSSCGMNGN